MLDMDVVMVPDTLESIEIPCLAPIYKCDSPAVVRIFWESCCRTRKVGCPTCQRCYGLYRSVGLKAYCMKCNATLHALRVIPIK